MNHNDIEQEIIYLNAIQELIDGMVNHEMMEIRGKDPNCTIYFKSRTHRDYFYILFVDLLSKSATDVIGKKQEYLEALKEICTNPHFDDDGSVSSLVAAVDKLNSWLEQKMDVKDLWFPSLDKKVSLSVSRKKIIIICGNMSKHNVLGLSGVANMIVKIFKEHNIIIEIEEALLVFDEFYEQFHDDILVYHASTIAELLNDIVHGIHEYLRPVYRCSIIDGQNPPYSFTCPENIDGKFAQSSFRGMMNVITRRPNMKKFKVLWALKKLY